MICLDTNYLILGLTQGSAEESALVGWTTAGETLVVAMPAWYEFLCGPVSQIQVKTMRAFVSQIIPFTETEADLAASLFNLTGRKRALRVDAMIAATALSAKARLATGNLSDFAPFMAHGLELV